LRLASELLGDHLCDDQPQTNSLGVHLACRIDAREQLKKLLLILILDPNPIVEYREHQFRRASWPQVLDLLLTLLHCLFDEVEAVEFASEIREKPIIFQKTCIYVFISFSNLLDRRNPLK